MNKGLSRRKVLHRAGTVGGGLVAASTLGVGPSKLFAAPLQVPRRTLGKTGEKIPILLQGGSMPFDPRFDPKLAEAFKYGVNYIDAADCYAGGACEPAVAAFHQRANVRNKLFITSKSDEHAPKDFEKVFYESLEKLKTSYIDMYYLHMLRDPKYINDELKAVVDKLKKEKKLKFFGFSCHHGNVNELLHLAAKTPWVDSVMFRFNFRQYGNDELNRAIDAAHKAKVGLIAMKTQSSAVSFEDKWKKFDGKWNKYQAVMKAVWADERITAAVSQMDSIEKQHENIAAALDKTKLTQAEMESLWKYAAETKHMMCDGCDHLCGAEVNAPVEIGSTLRYLMYHDVYGQSELAKTLYGRLPKEAREALATTDFRAASAKCPNGLDLNMYLRRAAEVLV